VIRGANNTTGNDDDDTALPPLARYARAFPSELPLLQRALRFFMAQADAFPLPRRNLRARAPLRVSSIHPFRGCRTNLHLILSLAGEGAGQAFGGASTNGMTADAQV
jgi:hypothetical protein